MANIDRERDIDNTAGSTFPIEGGNPGKFINWYYSRFGYDPDPNEITIWRRNDNGLRVSGLPLELTSPQIPSKN